jgi:peptidylprolyl isomerase
MRSSVAVIFLGAALVGCHREAKPATAPAVPAPTEIGTFDRGDGLTVEITKAGYGPMSKIGDEVTLVYSMRVKDAEQEIASTRDWLVPCRVRLGEKSVVPGLARGLEGLRAGSKARIEVPPALGYGQETPPGSNVPADQALVFDVEILSLR